MKRARPDRIAATKSRLHVRRAARWLAENRAAIDAYNQHAEQHGVFSDEWRSRDPGAGNL